MIKNIFHFDTTPEMEKVLGVKSSEKVFGVTFPEIAIQEAVAEMEKKDISEHGTPYSGNSSERPAKGAFMIVPEEGAAEMLYALASNGLICFTQRIAMDFSYKPIIIDDNPLTIENTPIESEMVLRSPKSNGEPFTLAGRIIIEDLQFLDNKGMPLFKELPKIIIEQILKALNPFEICRSLSATIDDMLKRAGDNAQYFKRIMVETAKKWETRQALKDAETLERYCTLAILHEAVHFLVCHLPDNLSLLSPEEAKH
jgi:hypothetical protein